MAIAMMYTVLLTRLGSNSLYRSTNCSCLQGHGGSGPLRDPCCTPRTRALLACPPKANVCACPSCPLALGGHSLLRAPGLGLTVQVDETRKVHAELQRDGEDGVQVEDVGQGPLSRQRLQGLQRQAGGQGPGSAWGHPPPCSLAGLMQRVVTELWGLWVGASALLTPPAAQCRCHASLAQCHVLPQGSYDPPCPCSRINVEPPGSTAAHGTGTVSADRCPCPLASSTSP